MPFDDTSRRLPVRRYSVMTGHPPVELQIADQVRTATGYTLGRATVDGARLIALSPRVQSSAAAASGPVIPGLVHSTSAGRLLRVLRWLARGGGRLPYSVELMRFAGLPNVNEVSHAMAKLVGLGAIREWNGVREGGPKGERIVTLVHSSVVLRTAGAPAEIVP